jgi:hypothetical protein
VVVQPEGEDGGRVIVHRPAGADDGRGAGGEERGSQGQRLVVVCPGRVRQAGVRDDQAARRVRCPVPGLVQDAGQRKPAVPRLDRRDRRERAMRGQLQQGRSRSVPARERA